MKFNKLSLAGALLVCGLPLLAQMDSSMNMGPSSTPTSGFAKDMDGAMKKMDHDMMGAPMNGITDHDFVTMMVPHHQGAIDMAEGELKYGKDPAMRRLARQIIKDQESEIKMMNLWLKEHPGATPAVK